MISGGPGSLGGVLEEFPVERVSDKVHASRLHCSDGRRAPIARSRTVWSSRLSVARGDSSVFAPTGDGYHPRPRVLSPAPRRCARRSHSWNGWRMTEVPTKGISKECCGSTRFRISTTRVRIKVSSNGFPRRPSARHTLRVHTPSHCRFSKGYIMTTGWGLEGFAAWQHLWMGPVARTGLLHGVWLHDTSLPVSATPPRRSARAARPKACFRC